MKIVPLFPGIQTDRTVQTTRSSRVKSEPTRSGSADTVSLKSGSARTSDLSRDEAFILLGRTLAQLDGEDDGPAIDTLHQVRGDRAVDLLIQE